MAERYGVEGVEGSTADVEGQTDAPLGSQQTQHKTLDEPNKAQPVDGVKEEERAEEEEEDHENVPMDPPLAPLKWPFTFWQDIFLLLFLGGALGAFGYGFTKAIEESVTWWSTADGNSGWPDDASTLQFGAGQVWYIGLGAATGLVVGLAKVLMRLDDYPSFIIDMRAMYVDPLLGAKIFLCCLLSLIGGAPMGPEAGLGAAAGAIGTLLAHRVRTFKIDVDVRKKLYVASAMCSAFAAIMPSPLVACLLSFELGAPPQRWGINYMHLIIILSAGSLASFVVYFAIQGFTYLNPLVLAIIQDTLSAYDQFYIVEGILFGLMGSALALVYILIGGVVKYLLAPVKRLLDCQVGKWPRVLLMCVLGGTCWGLLGWAMPLTLADGSITLGPIIHYGENIGSDVLAASCFAKGLSYHIAKETGFVGGMVFPMLAMGTMLGRIFVNETGVNPIVALSCSLIALPAALVPGPFFLVLLSVSSMVISTQGVVPIFATACTAYLFCMAVGMPQGLLGLAEKRKSKKAQAELKTSE